MNLVAVVFIAVTIWAGVASGFDCCISAAIVAACSAASELPQNCQPTPATKLPKKVVEAQSVAVMSGFVRTSGVGQFGGGRRGPSTGPK